MCKEFQLRLIFRGVDLDDDATIDALAQWPEIQWFERDGVTYADAFVTAGSGADAAQTVVGAVESLVAGARAVRLVDELVAISDVAARTHVHRETARLWATGRRGPGGFPAPLDVIGDGIRVWRWADVHAWLLQHYQLVDDVRYPNEVAVAEVNRWISARRSGLRYGCYVAPLARPPRRPSASDYVTTTPQVARLVTDRYTTNEFAIAS